MLSIRTLRAALALAVVALAVVVVVSPATSASKASKDTTIVIWADKDRVPAVTKIANAVGAVARA